MVTLTARPGRGEKVHLLVDGQYRATTTLDQWYSFGLPAQVELEEEQLEELLRKAAVGQMQAKALDLLSQRDYSRRELEDKLVQKAAQKQRRAAEPTKGGSRRHSGRAKPVSKDEDPTYTSRYAGEGGLYDFGVTDSRLPDEEDGLDGSEPVSVPGANYQELREQAAQVCEHLEELGLLNDTRFARVYASELLRNKHLSARGLKTALQQKGISREIAEVVLAELGPDAEEEIRTLLTTKFRNRDLSDEREKKRIINALLRLGYTYSEIRSAMGE
ncbi:MAG: RecX family transcriptional regulator [Clostridia bacterium]|nr:RecX family transcriptional regulator [Clostridia bacterium]